MSVVTKRLDDLDSMMEFRIGRINELKTEMRRAQKVLDRNPAIIAKLEHELAMLGTEFRKLRAIEKGEQGPALAEVVNL